MCVKTRKYNKVELYLSGKNRNLGEERVKSSRSQLSTQPYTIHRIDDHIRAINQRQEWRQK